jgi:hypothetical protein
VVANLLLHELEPELPALLPHAGRALVISGLLWPQRARLAHAIAEGDSGLCSSRWRSESQSGDRWCASLWLRTGS